MPGVALFACDAAGHQVAVYAGADHDGQPLETHRTVCLASVGKMAVALLVLGLVDRGRLSLASRLGDVCPEATGSAAEATIGDLLSHRAGVPPIIAETDLAYSDTLTWPDIRRVCLALDRQVAAPRRVHYSDAAYGLLGIAVEAVSGASLPECLAAQLNARLGTRLTLGLPPGPDYVKVPGTPTSFAGSHIEPLNSAFWHGLALPWAGICGAPHDGLALVRAFTARGGTGSNCAATNTPTGLPRRPARRPSATSASAAPWPGTTRWQTSPGPWWAPAAVTPAGCCDTGPCWAGPC